MARITDVAFRSLCVDSGCKMTVSELTSCEGIIRGQDNSLKQLVRADNEKNFSIQLFGGNPDSMGKAASLIENKCEVIDINMGCPVNKIMGVGGGCELTGNPETAGKIVKSIVKNVSIPVSAKIRLGLDKPDKALAVAKVIEDNGASFITIHGRTQAQGYSGKADWNLIKQVANSVSIPIIGNGDITSPKIAKNRLDNFNINGVAIGRGASGNPYLFTQVNDFLTTGKYKELTNDIRLNLFKKYLELAKEHNISFLHQKVQSQHVTKGMQDSAKIRFKLNAAKTPSELLQAVESKSLQGQ